MPQAQSEKFLVIRTRMRNALGDILCPHTTAAKIAGVNSDAAKREEGPFDAETLAKLSPKEMTPLFLVKPFR